MFKDRGDKHENVPLGFDDGTVFDREAIGRTLIPAMLSKPTDSDELPLSGYTPRNLFRREVIGSHRFRPDIRYAEGSALYRHLHEGRGPRPSRWTGRIIITAFTPGA